MGYHIAELRVDEVESALAFAKPMGCELKADALRPMISLLAREGDATVGFALAFEVSHGRMELYVGFDEQAGDMTLARSLADKVLQKIHSRGMHRCHIIPIGPADTPEFWQQVNWLDQTLRDDVA